MNFLSDLRSKFIKNNDSLVVTDKEGMFLRLGEELNLTLRDIKVRFPKNYTRCLNFISSLEKKRFLLSVTREEWQNTKNLVYKYSLVKYPRILYQNIERLSGDDYQNYLSSMFEKYIGSLLNEIEVYDKYISSARLSFPVRLRGGLEFLIKIIIILVLYEIATQTSLLSNSNKLGHTLFNILQHNALIIGVGDDKLFVLQNFIHETMLEDISGVESVESSPMLPTSFTGYTASSMIMPLTASGISFQYSRSSNYISENKIKTRNISFSDVFSNGY